MTVLASRAARRFAAAVLVVAAAIALKTSPVPLAAAGSQETRPVAGQAPPQPQIDVDARLKGFDDYMAQAMKDWNAPGIGIGIVVKDKLVFAKGYGFRDFGKKLPYTPATTQPIASNS
jgi:CubicO group peptidase (beta-lactamase class C family)